MFRVDYFRFGLVFIKKNNQTEIKKPKPVQTDRFRFGFLGQKPAQTGLARFWLGFFSFGSVFSWFGSGFFLVWVRFDFFSFRLVKPKLNRTGRFFQNYNRFFFMVWFFRLFFSQFARFNRFFGFFFSILPMSKLGIREN